MSKFCYNCGKEIVEGTAFCIECGAPVTYGGFQQPNAPQVAQEEPAPAPQVTYEEPAPQMSYGEPAPAPQVAYEEPTPSVTYEEPTPSVTYEEPTPSATYEEPAPKMSYEETSYSYQTQQPFASGSGQPFASGPQQPFASGSGQPFASGPAYQNPMQSKVTQNEARNAGNDTQPVVSTGAFFGRLLLFSIPVVGLILCLVMSLTSKNENVKHFSRAMLIYSLIASFLVGIFIAICLLEGWQLILFTSDTFL